MVNILDQYPILLSVAYYLTFLFFGHVLRVLVEQFTPLPFRRYILDAVTTFQVFTCSLENGQVRSNYGYIAYIVTIFFLSTFHSRALAGSSSNPCSHVADWIHGRENIRDVLLLVGAQSAGALLSYRAAKVIWTLGLSKGHRHRLTTMNCMSDLRVSVAAGLVMESLGALFVYMVRKTRFSDKSEQPAGVVEGHVKCLMECLLTAAGKSHLTAAGKTHWISH